MRRAGGSPGRSSPHALIEELRRIALVGPAPPDRGGIAHETARLARELSKEVDVEYLTFSRPYPRWLDPRRFAHEPRLEPAPARPLLDYLSPASWRRTAKEIESAGTQAVLVPWWTSFWALPVRAVFRALGNGSSRAARVLVCHNVRDHESTAVKRLLSVGAFDAADGFLVHSRDNRAEMARRFPDRPVEALPLPVLEKPEVSREEARRRLGLETGPLVLFLGLVRKYKGVDVLLDAAPRIVRETGGRIAVVGEVFPDARELARRRESSPVRDRILWKDEYVSEEEMALWLAACDVVALPYRQISASAIAARALAARRPIAAAEVGGLRDAVIAGSTGELFPAGDAGALAEAVERILRRAGSYEAALDEAAAEASWPRYARKVLEFVDVVRGRKP
ncbi:MAG TPA: glycosyltransferase [Thermoanaerobaculia bacterium]